VEGGTGREALESKELSVRPARPDIRNKFPVGFPVKSTGGVLWVDWVATIRPGPRRCERILKSSKVNVQDYNTFTDVANFDKVPILLKIIIRWK
jgi:hypothetical protein